MGFVKWIAGGLSDFLGGMLSEFLDWLVEVVVEIAGKLEEIIDGILGLFQFVPTTLKLFDRLGRVAFFFLPDTAFSLIEGGFCLIGIILIVKFLLRMLGK